MSDQDGVNREDLKRRRKRVKDALRAVDRMMNTGDDYDKHRERMRKRAADASRAERDIAPLPAVRKPRRKARCKKNFGSFCRSYCAAIYELPWSADHRTVIGKIERAVLGGELFAFAMPRGNGKTTLCESACLWAILYGHKRFIAAIGASEELASQFLDSLKVELETNELLLEDFPESVYPIVKLEGISHRCKGQTLDGKPTRIDWKQRRLVMPTVPGSPASGAIIRTAGLTGQIRGMKFKRADGLSVRPDLVVLDDPQTDESARSPSQSAIREALLAGAILGLAGPGKAISGMMPCTVIERGDMADSVLNRKKHPEWHGERTKLVYAWPGNKDLWDEYAALRAAAMRAGRDLSEPTKFYRAHRKAMDKGARVAWPERREADELSAIQHAVNLRLRVGEAAFASEYQNEPLKQQETAKLLTPDQVAAKINGLPRGLVPARATMLTAFIDVQQTVLYWLVAAWSEEFSGDVVDCGTYPDQQRPYFALSDVRRTLALAKPGAGLEGTIFAGLTALASQLLGGTWTRDDGAAMRIDRLLIDANWGRSTRTVKDFCRGSQFSALMPSHGRYYGASSKPLDEYRAKRGEQLGHGWLVSAAKTAGDVRHALYDTNLWKSFVQERLATAPGDRGCLSLFQATPAEHRLLAEHLTAEFAVRTEGRGRTVDEWKLRPERGGENHWLDCLVGAAVAASMQGASLTGQGGGVTRRRRRRVNLQQMRAQHKAREHGR